MSLIHEALKKAEKEKQNILSSDESTANPIIAKKKKNSYTTLLLIVLAISLAFLVYSKVFQKRTAMKNLKEIPTAAHASGENTILLKRRAHDFYKNNQWGEALNTWQQASLLLPTDSEIYNNLGLVLRKMGKKNEAQKAYNQALALNKDYPEALNNLGVLYLEDGFKEKAKKLLGKALELREVYADPHLNLAIIYEQEGNLRKANEYYQRFIDLSPELEKNIKQRIEEKLSQTRQ